MEWLFAIVIALTIFFPSEMREILKAFAAWLRTKSEK